MIIFAQNNQGQFGFKYKKHFCETLGFLKLHVIKLFEDPLAISGVSASILSLERKSTTLFFLWVKQSRSLFTSDNAAELYSGLASAAVLLPGACFSGILQMEVQCSRRL